MPLLEDEQVIETNPDQTQLTKRYTKRATAFIEQHKDQPFFLYLAHSMPHVPLYVSERFENASELGLYSDVIQEIDWSIGQIRQALKTNGLDSNTIFIFTSDNGPWLVYGNHAGSAAPFREGKPTIFEGGVRVPTIAWWTDHIPPGTESDAITDLIDVLPTFVELASAKKPNLFIDGESLWPLLSKQADTARTVHYYFQVHEL